MTTVRQEVFDMCKTWARFPVEVLVLLKSACL